MLEIDGAYGEGGGQLIRTAVAVAATMEMPIRVVNVRARRRNPGLAPQHVAAVRAVASLCDAQCGGVELHSTAITFAPRRLRGGDFHVDVGTAGSITLVLQAMLPVLVASRARCRVTIRGGTDVRAAPPIDYLHLVLLPLLAKMGVRAELTVLRRGYYPKGGGEVQLDVEPAARLHRFVVQDAGPIERVEIHAHVAQLPREIAERMNSAARLCLPRGFPVETRIDVCAPAFSFGPGGAIVLRALMAHTILGAAKVAERGVRAEQLGQATAEALARDLYAGATLDVHAADQMLVFLALAAGPSEYCASEVTSHASTAMWLLEKLAGSRFSIDKSARGVRVQVEPGAHAHA
jgi:RNA 3'-terminal phosphate cyclase (ATP)